MKKIIIILSIAIITFSGCKKENSSSTDIKNKIIEYKTQISELNSKIDELHSQLGVDTSVNTNILKVETISVKKEAFEHFVEATGNVDAVNNVLISPQMSGQIVKIYVKEGQYASKGQLLAKLNDDVLRKNLAQLQGQV